jgi:hypothetical protein
MTTKTIYVCDRCGEKQESTMGMRTLGAPWSWDEPRTARTYDLCPACSERALEIPDSTLTTNDYFESIGPELIKTAIEDTRRLISFIEMLDRRYQGQK